MNGVSEDDIKDKLKRDFKAHLHALVFKKSLVGIISDTLYKKPFQQIVFEAYEEALSEFKSTLCVTSGCSQGESERVN